MELIINYEKKIQTLRDSYEVIITYMENDADGYQKHKISISKSELEIGSTKREFTDFITCVMQCIEKDSAGREGICDYKGLFREYYTIPNWLKFNIDLFTPSYCDAVDETILRCIDETESEFKELLKSPSRFDFSLPKYGYGDYYTSYNSIEIFYYDENSDKFPVSINL